MSHNASSAGWMSPVLRTAWSFRAEEPPAATGAGQAPATGQPPAGTTTGTPPQAGGEEPTTGGLSLAEAQAELAKVRREAAGHRARATQLEKEKADLDASKLSDLEKAQRERDASKAELEALKAESQERINRYEVQLKAASLGIVDPEAAALLLDWGSIEYAEDGTPRNVETALKALLKAKPYLAGGTTAGAGAPMNPASGRGNGGGLTIAALRGMTQEQILRLPQAEVNRVLAGGG